MGTIHSDEGSDLKLSLAAQESIVGKKIVMFERY
jgi:hypothetical protein